MATKQKNKARKLVDWEAIEPDWRAGVKTKKQLSEEYKVSRAAIDKHFAKIGVERDLSAQIRAKAKSRVTRQVTKTVTHLSSVTSQEIIDVNAKMQSDIILAHRTDIPRKRELIEKLFAEVDALTDGSDIVEQMILALGSGDMTSLARQAKKVTSLPSRIKGVSDLISAFKTVVGMEVEVFGISEVVNPNKGQVVNMTTEELVAILQG